MMCFSNVNVWAVLLGAVINMGLGMAWYSPLLFGDLWMRALGRSREEIGPAGVSYIASTVAAMVSAYVLALIVRGLGITTAGHGLLAGAVTWVGIGATATAVFAVFQGPPLATWAIHGAYQLVAFCLQGLLFALWT
jgi:hypothetical protein